MFHVRDESGTTCIVIMVTIGSSKLGIPSCSSKIDEIDLLGPICSQVPKRK